MNNTDLEKDCESTISQVLTEQNKELETITNEKTLANLGPKELLALWRDKFGALTIADMKDTKGYTQVVKGIALCRTTRTTLDKKRMEQKRFFLDAGKVIDGHYKELIALVEPIEEELNKKKQVIDDEKDRIKREKEEALQAIYDGRVKRLMDAGCLFDGVSYYIKDTTFAITSIYIKNLDDAQFDVVVKKAEEEERLKEENARRTTERYNTLKLYGFTEGENSLERKNQSKKFFALLPSCIISREGVENMPQAAFEEFILSVTTDISTAKEEQELAQKEFEETQRKQREELDRRENELKEKEETAKRELHTNRMNKIKALGFILESEPWTFTLQFPKILAVRISINPDLDDAAFDDYLIKFGEMARDAKQRSDKAVEEAEKEQKQKDEARAKEIADELEKKRLAKEEEEKQKEQERLNRQPDKAKLKTLAERILAMDIPEFKSKGAKQIKSEVLKMLEDVSKYCKEEAEKL